MPTNFPGAIDALTNPNAGDRTTSPPHHLQHTNANDAIEAIEAELGINPAGGYATVAARFGAGDVMVADYGAVGDGTTDDTVALRDAIATGRRIWMEPGATYLYSGRLLLSPGQHIYGNGATLKRRAQITTTTTTTITAGATTVITVADASELRVGMALSIKNGASEDTSNREIASIVGNVVTTTTNFGISASGTTTVYTNHHGIVTAGDNRIYDLRFDGNKANYTFYRWQNTVEIEAIGDRNLIEGCYINNAPGEGIVAFGDFARVVNCVMTNLNGNGVHLGTSAHPIIEGCAVQNANLDTVVGHADGCISLSNGVQDLTVANCYLQNGISGVGAIDSVDNSDVTITGNVIRDCTTYALELILPTENEVYNVVVANNRIYDSVVLRIAQVDSGSSVRPNRVIVTGNYLENTRFDMARVNRVVVSGNIFYDLGDTTTTIMALDFCSDITIGDNQFVGGGMAIAIQGDAASTGLLIRGNQMVQQTSFGINMASGEGVVIDGNSIRTTIPAAGFEGIRPRNKTIVRGNQIVMTNGGSKGIYGLLGAIIKDNVVRHGTATYSIRVEQACIVKNNEVTVAVSDSTAGAATLSDNVVIA